MKEKFVTKDLALAAFLKVKGTPYEVTKSKGIGEFVFDKDTQDTANRAIIKTTQTAILTDGFIVPPLSSPW